MNLLNPLTPDFQAIITSKTSERVDKKSFWYVYTEHCLFFVRANLLQWTRKNILKKYEQKAVVDFILKKLMHIICSGVSVFGYWGKNVVNNNEI